MAAEVVVQVEEADAHFPAEEVEAAVEEAVLEEAATEEAADMAVVLVIMDIIITIITAVMDITITIITTADLDAEPVLLAVF